MAFTDRNGGYGHGAFGSFNLALHVGDEPALVTANRSLLGQALGIDRISFVEQVHGTAVHDVTSDAAASAGLGGGAASEAVEADAQVSDSADVGLAILVADCTPVLLADPDAGVIGAVHAGRRGMVDGIVAATVDRMRARGAKSIAAAIGPSIGPRRYEVPKAMRDEVSAVEPVTASVTRLGTPALDVAAGVAEQLVREGVSIRYWSPRCTLESQDLFSYRRDGTTGRFAGVVWLSTPEGATRPPA
ncbi:peptidoglycan editing factor PgeF [Brevibacterium jeotgali]|nr:peptidoglycan editing factor PgeF [Brevibacterium jeotgali]